MAHTPGPWQWEYNEKFKSMQLCGGDERYDLTVIDFVRWGMNGAAVRFRADVDNMNIMEHASKFTKPVTGRKHHAHWFKTIDHPDAHLIAAAPDLLEACREASNRLSGQPIVYTGIISALNAAIAKAEGKK